MSSNLVFEGRCYTEVKNKTGSFEWTIRNLSQGAELLESAVFPTSAPEGMGQWYLILHPYNDMSNTGRKNVFGRQAVNYSYDYDDLDDEELTFSVPSRNSGTCNTVFSKWNYSLTIYQIAKLEILATVKMSLINSMGYVPKSEIRKVQIFAHNDTASFSNFIERDKKPGAVVPTDALTIVCEITFHNCCKNQYEESAPVMSPLCQLLKDMGNLLSSESLTDLTIMVGERQFKAHKAILAARSPVFAAMFRNEMVENKDGIVKINDIDPDIFQELLQYIYIGKQISQTERSDELLAAADQYELGELKMMCEEALCKELSVENVLENIALADLYQASVLKDHALRFFVINSSNVIRSSSWNTFTDTHQHLLKEICEKQICILK